MRSWPTPLFFVVLIAVLAGSPVIDAQSVPAAIKIQGYLTDTSGMNPTPANGIHSMKFDVFDALVGGNLIASAGPLNVTVTDGRYEAELPLSPALFQDANRYLEITVNGELLTPRIRMVSVPFAFNAERANSVADDSITSDSLATGAVQLDDLGIVCADGEVLFYTVGSGWSCGASGGGSQIVCEPGTYAHCYTGPSGTEDVGVCQEGRADCKPDQTGFGSCSGEIVPSTEVCNNNVDDDCDTFIDCQDFDCTTDPACSCPDNDNDGFTDASCGGSDCDDTDAQVNPGATEICNNTVDDNCDGAIDCADGSCTNDPVCTGCPDNDNDGFADASCGGTDCNDNDPSINPGAAEVCDGLDNDCNAGSADGSDEPWFGAACDGTDSDLCEEGVFQCSAGAQVCSDNTTSDAEICNNNIDDDCDGATDCADGDCAADPVCTGCPDNDNDGFADASCGGTDCNDSDPSINPGAAEVCNNTVDDNCDGAVDCADGSCSADPVCN